MSTVIPNFLAQAASAAASNGYAYTRPFVQPLPVWDYWYLLLIPLVLGISLVYKAVKVTHVREVAAAALGMTAWIIVAFTLAAIGLLMFVKWMA